MLNSEYGVVETIEKEGCMQAAITHHNPHFSLIGFPPERLASMSPYQDQAHSPPQVRRKYFIFEESGPITFKSPTHAPRCSRAASDTASHSVVSNYIADWFDYTLAKELHGLLGFTYARLYSFDIISNPRSPQHRLPEVGL